jgi:TetR/AcrR family fatty acid metabolism transcriptional regulator
MPADTSSPTLKEVLRQKRTEYILQAAESIFAEKGYHDASMDEIAARAGVSKGTLYQHFPTKDELIFALIDRNLALFEQIIALVSAEPESARSKLERILHAVHVEQHGMRMQLNRLLESNEDLHRKAQEHKGKLRARVDKARQEIGRILEEGKANGIFDTTISTELMVQTFLHLLSIRKQERLFTEEHLTPEEVVAQMERLFFQGITSYR